MTNVANSPALPVLLRLLQDTSGIKVDEQEVGISFSELGLDSLFLTQFSVSVSNRFGVTITFRRLTTELNSLKKLAAFLDETRLPEPSRTSPDTNVTVTGQSGMTLHQSRPAGAPSPETTEHLVRLFSGQLEVIKQQLAMLALTISPEAAAKSQLHNDPDPASLASAPPEDAVLEPEAFRGHGKSAEVKKLDSAPATAHYASAGPVLDASRQPAPGARLGRDGAGKAAWFVPKPDSPGEYEKLEEHGSHE